MAESRRMQPSHGNYVAEEQEHAFVVEQRGIEYIPPEDRYGKAQDLFWMWAGAVTTVFFVITGALLITIGLSFAQSVALIVVGGLSYFLVGLLSMQGPRAGTSTFVISRAPYGQNGGRVLSLFNWFTMLGFEASGLIVVVLAFTVIGEKLGLEATTAFKVILILAVASLCAIVPLYGHRTVLKVLKWLVYPMAGMFLLMAVLASGKVDLGGASKPGDFATLTIGLVIVLAAGGFSWTLQGNDYSRYLPADTSRKSIFWWPSLGGLIPTIALMTLGAAVATATPVASDPISGLPSVFPSWFLVPYLLVIGFDVMLVTASSFYSSGLALQAVGIDIKRWIAVLIDAVICCAVCAIAVFSTGFNSLLTNFLSLIVIWLGPWVGIFTTDWLLRGGRYSPLDLLRDRGGLYWQQGGFHWPAMIAQAAGMTAAALCVNSAAYIGPVANSLGGADLSPFAGTLVGACVYLALGRASVRRQVDGSVESPSTGDAIERLAAEGEVTI